MGNGPSNKDYQAGAAARATGEPREANPHEAYSSRHYPWDRGWQEYQEPAEPDAPAADALLDLTGRVAGIIKKAYFVHTRNEQKAYETALAVLEEVQRTYEQLAEKAGLPTS